MSQEIPRIDFVTKMNEIKERLYIPALRIGNTGIGFTLETELGINENNYTKGDFIDTGKYKGTLFELKSQRYQKVDPRKKEGKPSINRHLISLVTQSPHGGLSNQELVSKYGYNDEKGRKRRNLYATVSATKFIKSKKNKFVGKMKIKRKGDRLFLTVDDAEVAYVDLDKILGKLENLFVVRADSKLKKCFCGKEHLHKDGYHEYFHFNTPCIFTGFNKEKFYKSIDEGKTKYDLRMHGPDGELDGNENYDTKHDHGTGFRTKFENISEFYTKSEFI